MKLSLERLARRFAELGGGSGMTVLTLAADPTVTPTAGAQTQYGIFGGKLYQHLTAMPDTNWLDLTDLTGGLSVLTLFVDPTITPTAGLVGQIGFWGGSAVQLYVKLSDGTSTDWLNLTTVRDSGFNLPVLTLLSDPTTTPTAGALSQFGFAPAGGGLYLHLSDTTDVNWLPLTLMVRALPVITLRSDPTTAPTAGATSQYGTFAGELFQHLNDGEDTEWLSVSSLLPAYTPKFTDLTEGELSVTFTMTDTTVLTVTKTAAQIRTAAIAQGLGGLSTGFVIFPHSDLAGVVGKVLDNAIPIVVVANVPFRAAGGLKQRASKVLNVYIDYNPEVTNPTTLDGVPTGQIPATLWTFGGTDYLQVEFDFHGVSRF